MYRYIDGMNRLGYTMLEFIDLQKVQDSFCRLTNCFMYALDGHGNKITEMSGNVQDVDCMLEAIGERAFESLYERMIDSPLEDQIVEDTNYGNVKIAALCIRHEGKPVICWLACCVLGEAEVFKYGRVFQGCTVTTTRRDFYRTLDLVRLMMSEVIHMGLSLEQERANSQKSTHSASALGASLKRSEALANVVRLLGSDQSFEELAMKALEILGTYLDVSGAQLLQVSADRTRVDLVHEWTYPGTDTFHICLKDQMRPAGYSENQPIVVSKETIVSPIIREFMSQQGLRSFISMPLFVKEKPAMYLSVTETRRDHIWSMDDVKFVSDVTRILQSLLERRIQKNSLTSSYMSLQAILDNVGTCIYVRDMSEGEVLFANKLMRHTFEHEMAEGTIDELLDRARPIGVREGYYEINHTARNRYYDMYYTHITWVNGKQVSLCALYDVTDKKIYQKKIEQQAYTDFLTGLYNRMCCERDLACQVDKAQLSGTKGGLLYLDLDDFKHINDGLGHQYGDVLLKSISNSLQRIDGICNSCYRMGGDEFVIIIPPESFERYDQIIAEINEIFSKPWFLKDTDYYCTMSMGACVFPDHGCDVQELIKKADIAMYQAKKSGKNRVCTFNGSEDDSKFGKRLDMEKSMRDASTNNCSEFEVYFQPIIDITKPGRPCMGAEALVRWNSTALGFIPPSDFIPLAEYLGLINPIGNHVMKKACEACKAWNDAGYVEYKVNVNLSVVQLLQNDIVETVERVLRETGIAPHNLTLEVTESLAINDMERMKNILSRIRSLGCRIALDDFGTGYSSLNHIRELPLDVIKVDQTFVNGIDVDEYAQSFIRMVTELGRAIDVNICVEGVETKEQLEILEKMKVQMIQGYHFDRPMQRAQFEQKYTPALQ